VHVVAHKNVGVDFQSKFRGVKMGRRRLNTVAGEAMLEAFQVANMQYHGEYGVTQTCIDAVVRILQAEKGVRDNA
jgi:hypothetical protein